MNYVVRHMIDLGPKVAVIDDDDGRTIAHVWTEDDGIKVMHALNAIIAVSTNGQSWPNARTIVTWGERRWVLGGERAADPSTRCSTNPGELVGKLFFADEVKRDDMVTAEKYAEWEAIHLDGYTEFEVTR